MAKKRKNKAQKAAKAAAKKVSKHGPLTGAIVALGAFASSLLASEKLREAAEQLISNAIARAAQALGTVSEGASAAAKRLTQGEDIEVEEEEEREEEPESEEAQPHRAH